MKVPRQWSGRDLVKALAVYGYEVTRQTGSHIRLTTHFQGEHHQSAGSQSTSARHRAFDRSGGLPEFRAHDR